MMDGNPLDMGIAQRALAFLEADGIVVDAQVSGLSLSTSVAENAFEARMKELGWEASIEIAALGAELGFPYYAFDRRVFDTSESAANEVRSILMHLPAPEII